MGRLQPGMDQPDQPEFQLAIDIIVPEEFAGFSMGELQRRRGTIQAMDSQGGRVKIRAVLPASSYDELQRAIDEGTQHLGKIRRRPVSE